ncbi:hypothetical protein CEXT_422771 [Caerostris extrusa]|uniref:Uncharacterized protein n=1 Tax=Caerostris extrusa TaxID=172846 RepID=A0AAV4V4W7_CAEEX|nr:hypothetical protein CEXT_422771 [Caerostris extrusa]
MRMKNFEMLSEKEDFQGCVREDRASYLTAGQTITPGGKAVCHIEDNVYSLRKDSEDSNSFMASVRPNHFIQN